ncbi:hypothetical protein XaFJ1_GM000147 [Xanthomonas albilineans]|nr:hypothetical protein XaFJ1_GM000147 [Xanthomonas albilineans]
MPVTGVFVEFAMLMVAIAREQFLILAHDDGGRMAARLAAAAIIQR